VLLIPEARIEELKAGHELALLSAVLYGLPSCSYAELYQNSQSKFSFNKYYNYLKHSYGPQNFWLFDVTNVSPLH
jgi:hypothetical protein